MKIIHPGEYYVSREDEYIGTLLGSCVSVCLYDGECRIAGMNHFMLPGRICSADLFKDRTAKYGITAINVLFGEMEKAGARKDRLNAKVFGGGHVLETVFEKSSIPLDNVRLARIMLELEDIPITEMVVGGAYTRKIIMEVGTGKVFLKSITKKDVIDRIEARDKEYALRKFNGGGGEPQ
ncbi:MAG: chemotaxis protein CheD [Spirochaetes bacterium]|nr:chemotaxis protein CheD [Spirochaetota bacterium]